MEHRTLELNLASAKDLKDVNLFSKMDVYAVVSLSGNQKIKTPVDRNGGTNPTWNFPMKFAIDELLARQNRLTLEIKLRCERSLAADKDVGQVHVPLRELLDQTGDGKSFQHVSYQVRKPSGKPKGALNFSYKFEEKLAAPPTAPTAPAVPKAEPVTAYPAPTAGSTSSLYPSVYSPPPPKYAAGYGNPPPPPPPQTGYGYPPQAGYAYAPQASYGYAPQAGYGYPPQAGYGYPPPQVQRPAKNNFGMGLGAGLLGGALGGLLIGDMISDGFGDAVSCLFVALVRVQVPSSFAAEKIGKKLCSRNNSVPFLHWGVKDTHRGNPVVVNMENLNWSKVEFKGLEEEDLMIPYSSLGISRNKGKGRGKNVKQLPWAMSCLTSLASALWGLFSAMKYYVVTGKTDTDIGDLVNNNENPTMKTRFYSYIKLFLWLSISFLCF
ncbi:xyloglucan glycosyltransferase 12 [Spatholobus suberectus]|nr:xyloglucan glycosyltransferase 12 [Spatholobus suberectus]